MHGCHGYCDIIRKRKQLRLAGMLLGVLSLHRQNINLMHATANGTAPSGHTHPMSPWGLAYAIKVTRLAIEQASGHTCSASVISPDQTWSQTSVSPLSSKDSTSWKQQQRYRPPYAHCMLCYTVLCDMCGLSWCMEDSVRHH